MPDLADRTEREQRLAKKIQDAWGIVTDEDREKVDWQAFEAALAQALEDELAAVFLIVFFLMLSDALDGVVSTEDAIARFGDPRRGAQVASDIVARSRALLDAGRRPDSVFSASRAQAIAITEITNAVTEAETAARRANEGERQRKERDPGAADRPPTPEELERSTPWVDPGAPLRVSPNELIYWITARDGIVCSICAPLDGLEYEEWRAIYPNGPAAHPFCRCWLRYVATGPR